MKFDIGDKTLIVGKRISVGAVFGAIAKIVATIYPDYGIIAYETALILTFLAQLGLANWFKHTTK